ncbi:MAG: hypothetical protein LBJ01_03250 [Tannerella sp.]|jgi:hypothetical protein|nr:hypothetical protein [Tannerella sp.]
MKREYQILIEDGRGVWRELELGADNLAWTCQVNDIAELADRNASYSQALKLPKTAGNADIFGYADSFDAVTDVPYRKHNCRVFCAGRTIAGKGSFLTVLKVSEYFECQVLSGNASFFELLQGAPMSDLDLGVFQICNRSMNPDTWHPAYRIAYGSDVVIPSWPYREGADVTGVEFAPAGGKYPVMSVDYILRQILSAHGYAFESNADFWREMYLSIASAEVSPLPEDLAAFDGQIHTHGWQPVAEALPSVQFQWDIDNDADGNVTVESPAQNHFIRWYIPPGQKIEFTITGYAAGTAGNQGVAAFLFKNMDNETLQSGSLIFAGEPQEHVWEYENESDGTRVIVLTATSPDEPVAGMGMTVRGDVVVAGGTANAGGRLVMSERTGFEKQFDFMKWFAQSFGLTFVVDEAAKKVLAFTMHLLYDNIKAGNVRDWSGKAVRDSGTSFGFTLKDYAQENIIAFEENSKDGVVDSAKFYIDNQTLKSSVELFKTGNGAGVDLPVYSFDGDYQTNDEIAASIPLVELKSPAGADSDSGSGSGSGSQAYGYEAYLHNASFPTTKPHLVELSDGTVSVLVSPFIMPESKTVYDYRIARHVTAQRVVDMGYSILQDKMLKHAVILEDMFFLTPEDMERFEPSIPVFVEKYGAYFYVNKIRNFETGKLTVCELVRC